jgi:hypothetical protein
VGRRRIQAELALLGYRVAELTVAKYMHRASPRPSRLACCGTEWCGTVQRDLADPVARSGDPAWARGSRAA